MKKDEFLKFVKAVKNALAYTEITPGDKAIIVDSFKAISKTEDDAFVFLKALNTAIASIKAPQVDLELLKNTVFEASTPEEDVLQFALTWKNLIDDLVPENENLDYAQKALGMEEKVPAEPEEEA